MNIADIEVTLASKEEGDGLHTSEKFISINFRMWISDLLHLENDFSCDVLVIGRKDRSSHKVLLLLM